MYDANGHKFKMITYASMPLVIGRAAPAKVSARAKAVLPEHVTDSLLRDNSIMERLTPIYELAGVAGMTTYDYCGNIVYKNGVPTIYREDGFTTLARMRFPEFHYYIRDHQGNIRGVTDGRGNIEQQNDYYPFGGMMASSTGGAVQPYRYTGKELVRFQGLDWLDYGARWYDPAILHWNGVDELAEKYTPVSPYVFCLNNPVNNIDSDGKKVRPIKYTGTNITYYHSPKEFQNAMIAFGKTTFGHQILSDFTPKGKSIFGVIGNGKYANYELNLHEFDFSNPQEQTSRLFVYGEGMVYAQTQLNFKDGKPQFDIIFDVQRSESELVETITHEIALHLSNYSEILETFQSTGNVTATRNVWNKETSAEQHNDVIKAGGGILRGTYNYKRTSSELIKRFPNLKSIFDIMHKEYEKRYK